MTPQLYDAASPVATAVPITATGGREEEERGTVTASIEQRHRSHHDISSVRCYRSTDPAVDRGSEKPFKILPSALRLRIDTHSPNRQHGSRELPVNRFHLLLVFLAPALGGFLYGYDIGATSFVLSIMMNDAAAVAEHGPAVDHEAVLRWWTRMTQLQQGFFVSALSLGAFVGSHVVWHITCRDMNRPSSQQAALGRRAELRIASYLYLLGTILNVSSGTVPLLVHSDNLGFCVCFFGRLCYGIAVGFVMHGAPAYMAEMCPPQYRGAMVSAKETVIVAGIVFGYAVGNALAAASTWPAIYALTFAMSLPMLVLTHSIPRSMRWLIQQNLVQEAKQSMQYLHHGDVTKHFQQLLVSIDTAVGTSVQTNNDRNDTAVGTVSPIRILLSPEYRSAMIASLGLILFQQCSGQPSVLSYATLLFEITGWSGHASVVTSVLMMCISTVTVALVDRVGRKKMLYVCCCVMAVSLMVLCFCFYGIDDVSHAEFNSVQRVAILLAMLFYIGGYQLGFGPITWTIVSEVFSLHVKGPAIALMVQVNYILNFLVQLVFPTVLDAYGWSRTFLGFAVCLTLCVVFVRQRVPETTGMTLEEIERLVAADGRRNDDDDDGTEKSPLLGRQTPVMGAWPSLEEMESQIILQRTRSDPGFAR